jgi:hypothetical protein
MTDTPRALNVAEEFATAWGRIPEMTDTPRAPNIAEEFATTWGRIPQITAHSFVRLLMQNSSD